MIRSIKQLYGDILGATDGEIGHVKDFYFDDQEWMVRYLVADTGSWLMGRQVLLAPQAFGSLYQSSKRMYVSLTKQQIENSPTIETHRPVSRQYEMEYYRHYGWPHYWPGEGLAGMGGFPILENAPEPLPLESASVGGQPEQPDAHLRSTRAVKGYGIQATDGVIGHLSDFLMDDNTWAIGKLVVKTGHRLTGQEVQIPTDKVARISYKQSLVVVNLTMAAIEHSPVHQVNSTGEVI